LNKVFYYIAIIKGDVRMFNKKDIIILTSLVEKELNSKKYLTDSYIKNLENLNSKLEGYLQYLEDEGC